MFMWTEECEKEFWDDFENDKKKTSTHNWQGYDEPIISIEL